MTWPCVDHSGLSPSGRVSKRARKAWLKVQHDRLFPAGYWDEPAPTEEQKREANVENVRRQIERLRELASRGMSLRKFTKRANALEAEVTKEGR